MIPSSRRSINVVALIFCAALLGYAYYSQFYLGLEPCPLCIFQRVGVMVLTALFLLAALHQAGGWGTRVYAALIGITALAGAVIAARHVWLQHLPPGQVPECGPGLDYMLQAFPLNETLRMVFTGSGECAEVDWAFLGLSMPAWVLISFVLLGVTGLWANWRTR
jgi:disulfide bond formation protein DsbB